MVKNVCLPILARKEKFFQKKCFSTNIFFFERTSTTKSLEIQRMPHSQTRKSCRLCQFPHSERWVSNSQLHVMGHAFLARLDQWKHNYLRMLALFQPVASAENERFSGRFPSQNNGSRRFYYWESCSPWVPRPPLQCWLFPRHTIGKLPRNVHIRHSDGRFRESIVAIVSTLKGGRGRGRAISQ